MTTPERPHDPPAIFAAFEAHNVDYVTVGGLAVGAWGHPRATKDTDVVVPSGDQPNDKRLRDALGDLNARPLALEAPGAQALGIRWALDANVERWETAGGVLDVMRDPEGAAPYPELREHSQRLEAFGALTRVVGREHLIAMKLAAGRVQDLLDVQALVDPRNTEADRTQRRQLDRGLLRAADEPRELGEPVDPAERELDDARLVLAPTTAASKLERQLITRAREMQGMPPERVAKLAEGALPRLPTTQITTASATAAAAVEIEPTEQRELDLLRARERLSVWQRRERRELTDHLGATSSRVEDLRAGAEEGLQQLRESVERLEAWYADHGRQFATTIAAQRERYRRDRVQLAARVDGAPEQPAGYITELLGQRPAPGGGRERWDSAARTIEAYAARTGATTAAELTASQNLGRELQGAWERMRRATSHAPARSSGRGPSQPQRKPDSRDVVPRPDGPLLGR
jgi:hypothetical protein